MPSIIRILLCLVCIAPVFADKPLLAVLPVKVEGAEAKNLFSKEDVGYMSDAIRAEASRRLGSQVQILSQLQIDKLVTANIQECSGVGCFAGFLKTISADYGLQPTVRFAAGKLRLTLEMASNEATLGMREYAQANTQAGKNDLIEKSKNLASELYEQMLGELGVSANSTVVTVPKVRQVMAQIPAGCFQMGSNDGDADEKPVHRVCLSAFQMDKYEVTQGQYRSAMGDIDHTSDGTCWAYNPSSNKWEKGAAATRGFLGDNKPALCVDWTEAKSYCEKQGKRLPTEAESEYATRAGTSTNYFWGNDPNQGCRYANGTDQTPQSNGSNWNKKMECKDGYGDAVAPVGSYQPNPWGLFDMTGNVLEWTSDWYGSDYYGKSTSQDPKGPASGTNRVYRGGGWLHFPAYLRSADRYDSDPSIRYSYLGFRCAL